ncbi:hypothetical protein BGP_4964 [Beggiatoa sp. PS]|nr:hypothetical protein BGP_4964 [Beggiatoa sp. PS]
MKTELRKLVTKLEQKMSSQYPINLLMLVEREGYANFRLLISSEILKSDLTTNRFLSKELAKILSQKEFKILSRVEVVDSRSDFFIETKDYLENNGNPEELYNLEFGGLKITRALVIVSPVHHSKKYIREAELKQVLMQLKQLLEREYVTRDELKQWITQKENFSTMSSEKQDQLSFSQKTLQNKRETIFQKDSING